MDFTYFETAMAFLGLASIVIGSFADRLKEHVLRDDHDTAQGGKKNIIRDPWRRPIAVEPDARRLS